MSSILWVALGGAIGSVARFGVTSTSNRVLGTTFPWGTLIVNVLGCFVMGLVVASLLRKMPDGEGIRLFLATGVLGGFTTFSAFSLDVMNLMQRGENGWAIAYAMGSVLLSVLAVFAGFVLVR